MPKNVQKSRSYYYSLGTTATTTSPIDDDTDHSWTLDAPSLFQNSRCRKDYCRKSMRKGRLTSTRIRRPTKKRRASKRLTIDDSQRKRQWAEVNKHPKTCSRRREEVVHEMQGTQQALKTTCEGEKWARVRKKSDLCAWTCRFFFYWNIPYVDFCRKYGKRSNRNAASPSKDHNTHTHTHTFLSLFARLWTSVIPSLVGSLLLVEWLCSLGKSHSRLGTPPVSPKKRLATLLELRKSARIDILKKVAG
jgi:hypothetical protein